MTNMMRQIAILSFVATCVGCTTYPQVKNCVARLEPDQIYAVLIGRWVFIDDEYHYPRRVVVNPTTYCEISEQEDLDHIIPLIQSLKQREVDDFILMCGHLAQVVLVDKKLHWVGILSINADGKTVTLLDEAFEPRQEIVANSPELARAVFVLMQKYAPKTVDDLLRDNPCLEDSFGKYRQMPNKQMQATGVPPVPDL
ncbi:MAG TPA: hypothetical protein P5169_02045 [Kiritimatiellia bacterium]|nr:hypothetical protein [Kiritimatiellia bacterium]